MERKYKPIEKIVALLGETEIGPLEIGIADRIYWETDLTEKQKVDAFDIAIAEYDDDDDDDDFYIDGYAYANAAIEVVKHVAFNEFKNNKSWVHYMFKIKFKKIINRRK